MSHSADYEDRGPTTAYYQGFDAGERAAEERIIKIIESNKSINSDQAFFLVQAIKRGQK